MEHTWNLRLTLVKCTGLGNNTCTWSRECCKQAEAIVVRKARTNFTKPRTSFINPLFGIDGSSFQYLKLTSGKFSGQKRILSAFWGLIDISSMGSGQKRHCSANYLAKVDCLIYISKETSKAKTCLAKQLSNNRPNIIWLFDVFWYSVGP